MKILIVSTFDINGGAFKAAHRLFDGLKKYNIKSKMLVQKKFTKSDKILEFNNIKINYDQIILNNYPNKTQTLFSSSFSSNLSLIEYINNSDVDIVHFHWFSNGFFSLEDLLKINKPIVFSLHDMYLFTGGCHYTEHCEKYLNTCGNCIVLKSQTNKDLSYINFKRKQNIYNSIHNFNIIGLSNWISDCARKSKLLQDKPIFTLPNPINTNEFKPLNTKKVRNYLNLPIDKKIILFGAMNATDDPRKGYSFLKKALENLEKENYIFLVFGESNLKKNTNFIYLGHIDNELELCKIYSCADVMVVPSVQENLANTIIESMSCGTPVVAFDIGGNSDIIQHNENGYLAKPYDCLDLAFGIKWIVENPRYYKLRQSSRNRVIKKFDEKIVIPKYINLYNKLLNYSNNNLTSHLSENLLLNDLLINSFSNYLKNNQNINFSILFNKFFQQINNLNGNFVIYGFGTIGKTIQSLIPDKIVGYVDIAEKNNHPENLKNLEFDKIIISVLGRENEIIDYLVNDLKIENEKIITLEI